MPRGATTEKKTLLRGVLVLLPAALFTKCVGLFYKIPLLFIVGVEGMAYFLAAYHVYATLFVLASTGLPTALSLQVARRVARGECPWRTLLAAQLLFLTLGACGTLSLMLAAAPLARLLAIEGAEHALRAIAPSLFFTAFIGAARGYFQGQSRMGEGAAAEVIEGAGKLCLGLLFAYLARRRGLGAPYVAAAAILGITAGLALSALFLLVCLWREPHGKGERDSARHLTAELARTAMPITASAAVMAAVSLIDTALISTRLIASGVDAATAHTMYSSFGNLAVPLYALVPALLAPVTLSLMPLIAATDNASVARSAWRSAVRLVTLACVPAAMGLALFAKPLLTLLYAGQEEAISVAAPTLALLAASVLPAGLSSLMGAALQARGRGRVPVLASLCGAAVKLITEWVLLPRVLLLAAPISTLCCTLTVLLLEWRALRRALGTSPVLPRELWRPLFTALPAVALGFGVHTLAFAYCTSRFVTLAVVALVAALYLPLALALGAIEREDILALPKGVRILHALQRLKLIKGSKNDDDCRKKASDPCKAKLYR